MFAAYDLETETLVTLKYSPNPYTSWAVTCTGERLMQFDDLVNATNYVVELVSRFRDSDAPTDTQVLDAIIANSGAPLEYYLDEKGSPCIYSTDECEE